MATANEILAAELGLEDIWFEVDLLSRQIVIPKAVTNLGVKSDADVMHVRFKLPRFYYGVDFSQFKIGIDYTNAEGEEDRYEPEDITVGGSVITFTWIVGRHAALYKGSVTFGLCAKRLNPNDPDDPFNEFHTTKASLPILDGMETCEEAIVMHTDLLEQWREQLFGEKDSLIADINAASEAQQEVITQKGIEVLATIPEDYQNTFKSIDNADRTKADAIVCSAQGEIISVSDSSDDHLRGLKIFGKSTQVQTTGAQLFDAKNCEGVGSNNSINISDDEYTITAVGGTGAKYCFSKFPLDANKCIGKTLIMSVDSFTGGNNCSIVLFCFIGGANVQSYSLKPGKTSIICPIAENIEEVKVHIYTNDSGTELTSNTTATVKGLTVSYEASSWEPYTDGLSTPHPEYLQDIVSIENPTITIYGKNLWDHKHDRQDMSSIDGWGNTLWGNAATRKMFKSNTTYTMSFDVTCLSVPEHESVFSDSYGFALYPTNDPTKHTIMVMKTGEGVFKVGETRHAEGTFTTPSGIEDPANGFLVLRYTQRFMTADGMPVYATVKFDNVQIEIGSKTTEYEEYCGADIPTSYTLPGIPVTFGGNYTDSHGQQWICDEIDFERSVYVRRINSVELTGEEYINQSGEKWQKTGMYSAYAAPFVSSDLNGLDIPDAVPWCFSTHARSNGWEWVYYDYLDNVGVRKNIVHMSFNNIATGIAEDDTDATKLAKFRAYLADQYAAGTPVTVWYPLATPIETPLTAEEIQVFKALYSNYHHTTVLNDVGATMELKYNADTTIYLNNLPKFTDEQVQNAVNAWLDAHFISAEGVSF